MRNQALNSLRQRRAGLAADCQRMMAQFDPVYPAAKALKSQLDRSIARRESRISGSLLADYGEAQKRGRALQSKSIS